MEKVISIEGMACMHCVNHVQQALSAVPGVKEAKVDLESKSATVSVDGSVTDAALKAAAAIGDGLYGVDLKQVGSRNVVIEVNDNPSIDAGVEDAYLGDDLYRRIMSEFLRRMEKKRLGIKD